MRQIFYIITLLFVFIHGKAQKSTASAQVSTFTIESPQLGYIKKIWVYLPKGYALSSKKYPVIYMHDAQNLFDKNTSYSGEWNVDETLDSLNAEVIIIGIEHGNEKRLDELTPFPNEKYGGGKADDYLKFIVNTLKPTIDSRYRIKISAKNTAIAGSSLGGLVSYYATLKYPEVFGKAIIFSPSFWFSEDIYSFAKNKKKIKSKVYFLAGDKESDDMVSDLEKMYTLLGTKRCGCLHLSKKTIISGGQHNEKLWRENFANAYLWLF
ncbi:MAG TPA: alpha/beta hydrolase-fold protein [Flavobacterium sp.]|jgi:alpha-glucosidase